MPQVDSLDKIIGGYFAAVCAEPFTYKDRVISPRPIHVSPLIFRGYTCPAMCGGCCTRFSLDYIPGEEVPPYSGPGDAFWKRQIILNGKLYWVESDMQGDHNDHHCRNLNKEDGRCKIHGKHPFSCDFELIRFISFAEKAVLTQKLYGRGWAMLRIDGERGARCEMTAITRETIGEVVRKLKRLKGWMAYFEVPNHVDAIIKWAETGPHLTPLIIT